jgi:hypothetical protein
MAEPSHQSLWSELGVNVAAPTFVLMFLSGDDWLGPLYGLLTALVFPVGRAVFTLVTTRNVSFINVLGFISVLLTGGIGVFEIDVAWFAWKEAVFPFFMGIGCVLSLWTRWPALPALLDAVLDSERVLAILTENEQVTAHNVQLRRATFQMGLVCIITAIGTFVFARYMVVSPGGTEAFNTELGWYTGLSLPVLALPSTLLLMVVLRNVLLGLEERTGMEIDDLLK